MEENKTNILSNKKNAIIGLIAVIVVVLVVVLLVKLIGPSPAKTVKKFCKYMNDGEIEKAFKLVDFESVYVLEELDEDEYEDYAEELKDFRDDEDKVEELEDFMDDYDDYVEEIEEFYGEFDEYSIKVKEIKSTKKEGKNIWKVKAKVEYVMEYEDYYIDEDETETLEFYVVKKGMKYYLASGNAMSTLMGGY